MSIMLEPGDVDDEYFTPVASTTLASIFKDDSNNEAVVNPSLKYRPPQPKRTDQTSKLDDHNTTQCVFSCSVIAYEWVQGAHKCKGKVGFAMIRIAKTGPCKIILYSPDKSTLSCTTIVSQQEVTVKGAMLSLYDDHKQYWGLYFNDKVIDQVMELLKGENVIIRQYVNPELKPESEISDSDEAVEGAKNSNTEEDNAPKTDNDNVPKNDKASILNRIAHVGHAILPSLLGSPAKKTTPVDVLSTLETCDSEDKSNVLSDISEANSAYNTTVHQQDFRKSVAIQTSHIGTEINNTASYNIKQSGQTSASTLPIVNNQIFTYVNGYFVPLHMQVPIVDNIDSVDTSADIEIIIQKLSHLKGVIKAMEIKNNFQCNTKKEIQSCDCKSLELQNSNLKVQNYNNLKKISDMELIVKEKEDLIMKLRRDVHYETKNNSDIIKDHQLNIHELNELIENLKHELKMKDEDLKQMIPKKDADMLLANAVKSLMNNTFRSVSSNFDNEESYTGNNVKAILAAVIKKNTVESLSALFSNEDTSTNST